MYKRLEYAYPSSTIGGKNGLWFITVRKEDTLSNKKAAVVYSNVDKDTTISHYNMMEEQESKYSL